MGGRDEVMRANVLDLAILVRNESARILKDLPPTQLCKVSASCTIDLV